MKQIAFDISAEKDINNGKQKTRTKVIRNVVPSN